MGTGTCKVQARIKPSTCGQLVPVLTISTGTSCSQFETNSQTCALQIPVLMNNTGTCLQVPVLSILIHYVLWNWLQYKLILIYVYLILRSKLWFFAKRHIQSINIKFKLEKLKVEDDLLLLDSSLSSCLLLVIIFSFSSSCLHYFLFALLLHLNLKNT